MNHPRHERRTVGHPPEGSSHHLVRGLGLTVPGLALLLLAAMSSSQGVEATLLGEASGRLSWGPGLFRGLLVFHGLICLAAAGVVSWRRGLAAAPRPADGPLVTLPIVLTCLVALLLRLWHLNSGLWYDEVITLVDFIRLPLREIVAVFPSQNQHMFYSILAHFSTAIFGESTAAVRLPAVILGVGSIWAIYLLGRRICGERVALLASLLTTFSYHHIWFSQNARGYTGLLFFTVLSTWLWLEARSRGGSRLWLAYAAVLSLGLWTHLTMVFVWVAHAGVFAVELLVDSVRAARHHPRELRRERLWMPIAAYGLATSACLQLYALSLPEFLGVALHEESLDSQWTNPLWAVMETLSRLQDAGLVGFVAVAGLAIMGLGWASIGRKDWRVALIMVLPGVLGGAVTVAMGHNIWPRFFFFCMGFAVLSAVQGTVIAPRLVARLARVEVAKRLPEGLGVAAVVVLIALSTATVPRCYSPPKQDFAGAREYVERSHGSEDGFVAVGLAGGAFQKYFAPDWPVPATRQELERIEQLHETTWLVYTLPIQLEAWHPDIWEKIEEDYEIVTSFPGTLGGGAVVVCRTRAEV